MNATVQQSMYHDGHCEPVFRNVCFAKIFDNLSCGILVITMYVGIYFAA